MYKQWNKMFKILAENKTELSSKTKNSYNFMKAYPDNGGSKFLHNIGRCL